MMTSILQRKIKHLSTIAAVAIVVFLAGANGNAAEPIVVPPDPTSTQTGIAPAPTGKVPPKGLVRESSGFSTQHILVKISPDVGESEFLERARGLGLRKLKRLADTNWYTMALPANANIKAREMAAAAKGLPESSVPSPIRSSISMT